MPSFKVERVAVSLRSNLPPLRWLLHLPLRVEHADSVFDWPAEEGDFATTLPTAHKSKAATWLTILGHAVGLDDVQAANSDALSRDIAAVWIAALCEWLHGFEAASGNGFNHFDSEFPYELMPSDFYLGFELARLSGDDLESACASHDADIDDLHLVALKAITALFWALNSAIWPSYADDYPRSMKEAIERDLGSENFDDLATLDTPWRYVTEGWCEEAEA